MLRARRAFTLVEVLIVVIVLGILAAIVVPQFSSASQDATLSAAQTTLQTMRAQLELYKLQHLGSYPTLASFAAQMTAQTDVTGAVGTDYGPYILAVPVNPFTNDATLTTNAAAAGQGWYYNETTGDFRLNDSVAHRAL